MAPRKEFVVPKSQSGLSAPMSSSTGGTRVEIGEGTKILDLPAIGPQHARTVKDLQAGSEKLGRGIFPGVGKRGSK